SVTPQARVAGVEVLVVDDGPDEATCAVAARHGARYLRHDAPRGLNAARNTALEATDASLVCFVDDDVGVRAGWLDALLGAAAATTPACARCAAPPTAAARRAGASTPSRAARRRSRRSCASSPAAWRTAPGARA